MRVRRAQKGVGKRVGGRDQATDETIMGVGTAHMDDRLVCGGEQATAEWTSPQKVATPL